MRCVAICERKNATQVHVFSGIQLGVWCRRLKPTLLSFWTHTQGLRPGLSCSAPPALRRERLQALAPPTCRAIAESEIPRIGRTRSLKNLCESVEIFNSGICTSLEGRYGERRKSVSPRKYSTHRAGTGYW